MPKVECLEDVFVINETKEKQKGQPAFVKGNVYRTYRWNMPDGYGFKRVTCAKNEFGERHIIKDHKGAEDEFYNKHFKSVG
jgi:hypothetical protein